MSGEDQCWGNSLVEVCSVFKYSYSGVVRSCWVEKDKMWCLQLGLAGVGISKPIRYLAW